MRMATRTISWKLIGFVIRVDSVVIIRLVTTYAGIRRIVIIAIVAVSALVGNGQVSPLQDIKVVVVWHGGRIPTRCCSVARSTICG